MLFLGFLFKWPVKEVLETATCLLAAYAARRYLRQSFLKYLTLYEDRLASLEDNGRDLKLQNYQNKAKLFQQFLAIYDKSERINDAKKSLRILEIGIGCGNNFQYYPPSKQAFFKPRGI